MMCGLPPHDTSLRLLLFDAGSAYTVKVNGSVRPSFGGNLNMRKTKTVMTRLMEQVEPDLISGCWLCTARPDENGYPKIKIGGRTGKLKRAHRVSYELHKGPIENGLHVLHKCDVPACVNPAHLFLGTNADNVADRVSKGRSASFHGSDHPRAVLTDQQVRDILALKGTGIPGKKVAESYPVHWSQIYRIWSGAQWVT